MGARWSFKMTLGNPTDSETTVVDDAPNDEAFFQALEKGEPIEQASEAKDAPTPAPKETDEDQDTSIEDDIIGDETETDGEDGEESDDDETDEENEDDHEMVEFNFGGNKLEVKKGELPDELAQRVQDFSDQTWKDYTKGKQAVAEQAKTMVAREATLTQMENMNGELLQSFTNGQQLANEIQSLKATELPTEAQMRQLWETDQDQARRLSDSVASHMQNIAKKEGEFQTAITSVGQQEQAINEANQLSTVQRSKDGEALLNSRIKDFSTVHAPDVVKYVQSTYGMSEGDASQWAGNPAVTEMAYKAMQYDKMKAKAAKPKPKQPTAKPMKAVKSKGKSNSGVRTHANMSDAEFEKAIGLR
jgi:hypothetical protein